MINLYLAHAKNRTTRRSYYERKLHPQLFARAHGFRRVNDPDCLPLHLPSWLGADPDWKSDWTKANAVAAIHRPFS